MKKTIVISGSSSLTKAMNHWRTYWETKGYEILDWPDAIQFTDIRDIYPSVHTNFYKALERTSCHFVANEQKNGIDGYIGVGVFSEIAFRVGINLTRGANVPIFLLKEPSKDSYFYNDIMMWISFGWIQIFEEK